MFVNTEMENEKHCYHTLCAASPRPTKFKSHWLQNKTKKHFRVPQPRTKVSAVPNRSECFEEKVLWGARRGLLSLCGSLQHLQCIVAALSSGDPSVSTPNTIQSKEAIKIPSCRKKPLRRVDARRRLANMKRSWAGSTLPGSLQRLTQKLPNRAGTNSFFIVFSSSEGAATCLGSEEPSDQGVLTSEPSCGFNGQKQLWKRERGLPDVIEPQIAITFFYIPIILSMF